MHKIEPAKKDAKKRTKDGIIVAVNLEYIENWVIKIKNKINKIIETKLIYHGNMQRIKLYSQNVKERTMLKKTVFCPSMET